jgi:hypothetical protein
VGIRIVPVAGPGELRQFVRPPFTLYHRDPHRVETNTRMIRAIEAVGAKRYKTYRLYEKAIW